MGNIVLYDFPTLLSLLHGQVVLSKIRCTVLLWFSQNIFDRRLINRSTYRRDSVFSFHQHGILTKLRVWPPQPTFLHQNYHQDIFSFIPFLDSYIKSNLSKVTWLLYTTTTAIVSLYLNMGFLNINVYNSLLRTKTFIFIYSVVFVFYYTIQM